MRIDFRLAYKGQTLSGVCDFFSWGRHFSQRSYREEEGATFDWFKKYEDVADILRETIPDKNARILMLGCGNSTLSEDVYNNAQLETDVRG